MKQKPPKPTPNGGPPATGPEDLAAELSVLFPEITHPKKREFLMAFVLCASRTKAAKIVGIDPRNHWWWRQKDGAYAEAFARAETMAADAVEDRIAELALEGYEEGVWHQGQRVGTQRKWLATLMLAYVNAGKPQKYKYRSEVEHTLSPALLALHAQWQAQRDEANRRAKPGLPAHETPEVIDAEVTPLGDVRPPGASSREEFYARMDKINQPRADWRIDGEEEES